MKEEGTLYDSLKHNETPLMWDEDKVEVTSEETIAKPAFIKQLDESSETPEPTSSDLESDVNSWVDYMLPRFHPRTVNIIKQYKHDCTTHPFNIYNYGKNLWNTEKFSDDFSERIRSYVEECDLMQGFQARG